MGLTAAICLSGLAAQDARRLGPMAFRIQLVFAATLLVLFVSQCTVAGPLILEFRLLHLLTVLCHSAILLAGLVRLARLADDGRALLLGFSLAIAVFGVESYLGRAPMVLLPNGARWEVQNIPDPDLEFRYAPHSTAKTFYPDNPRGYFENDDPRSVGWGMETHGGSEARLERPEDRPGDLRVVTIKAAGPTAWNVKLWRGPLKVRAGREYQLSFRARAGRPRTAFVAVGQAVEPWADLGLYRTFDLKEDWQRFTFSFIARSSESQARLFFDLAASDAPVELADVALQDAKSGAEVRPVSEPFVTYRFNSLGFRGPDYSLPRPPGTFRILALGDSFTLGSGVHERDTFTSRMQRALNPQPDRTHAEAAPRYEVINSGVSGYATWQERRSYEKFSAAYGAQLVLLVMVSNDDLSFLEEQRLGYARPPTTAERFFRIWGLLRLRSRFNLAPDFTGAVREVQALAEACRERGARLAVVVFRNSARDPRWFRLLSALEAGLPAGDPPVLDLGPSLLADRAESDLHVHETDSHPNEIAHGIASEEILKFLRAQHLLPSASAK
jgi:hypothetical protein